MLSIDVATSVRALPAALGATIRRFRLSIFCALVATLAAIRLSYLDDWLMHWGAPLMLSASLGISLGFAVRMLAERRQWSSLRTGIAEAGVIVILALYFIHLPVDLAAGPDYHIQRFLLFAIAAHLLVAVLPFARSGSQDAFWRYNKTLFLRILTALLYSVVLYAGLSVAVLAVEMLFDVNFPSGFLWRLWLVTIGIFNTLVFLGGIPNALSFDQEETYPRGLKIFTQYVLLPLVTLYLLILYVYVGKILVTWDWPRGWVSYLIIGFSSAGILSLLLTYPIQFRHENRWLVAFGRFFYALLIPLVPVLFIAIGQRISDYGVTEPRYFVVALAMWLAFVSLYFTVSRSRNIKIIPASLLLIVLVSSAGPFSAFEVSRSSQTGRLGDLFSRHNLLEDGVVHTRGAEVPIDQRNEIEDILAYLVSTHGLESVQRYFAADLRLISAPESDERDYRWLRVQRLMRYAGLEHPDRVERDIVSVTTETDAPVAVSGFDLMKPVRVTLWNSPVPTWEAGGIQFRIDEEPAGLWASAGGDSVAMVLGELFARDGRPLHQGSKMPKAPHAEAVLRGSRIRFILRSGTASPTVDGTYRLLTLDGVLLIENPPERP